MPFVLRNIEGKLTGLWPVCQYQGQEELPDDHQRDAVGLPFVVTPQMVAAGVSVLVHSGRMDTDCEVPGDGLLVREVFAAMWGPAALAPHKQPGLRRRRT
jgi:hypothetical protein